MTHTNFEFYPLSTKVEGGVCVSVCVSVCLSMCMHVCMCVPHVTKLCITYCTMVNSNITGKTPLTAHLYMNQAHEKRHKNTIL